MKFLINVKLIIPLVPLFSFIACHSQNQKTSVKYLGNAGTEKSLIIKTPNNSLPKATDYVNDFEHVFSQQEIKNLDSLIYDFEKKTTIQIAVVTIDTTMTTIDSFDNYTLKLLNSWGVGQKEQNNGILIGISTGYQKMRIQNGFGIEKMLTNEETKEIIDSYFLPHFRVGSYYRGTLFGLQALMKMLSIKCKDYPSICK